MNFTFLLGNGFDVGLGLQTRYKDFYPYFIKNANKNNIFRLALEEDSQYEKWSDLEIALGEFTGTVSISDEGRFVKDKIEIDELLKAYLLGEQNKFIFDKNRLQTTLKEALMQARIGNNERENELIKTTLNHYAGEYYTYQCITYNYTDCADKMWKLFYNTEVGKHHYGGATYGERFGQVLHIHGSLTDGEMIIGVNDETQISNAELAKRRNVKWAMIKPYLNNAIGQNKIQKAKTIIDGSRIICLYGLSIGITDNMWWEYIGEWLKRQSTHILIIYNYDPDYMPGHPLTKLTHAENIRNTFLKKTKLKDPERQAVESRIIVYDNMNIFAVERLLRL